MLRRKIYERLVEWKNRDHKCLLVKGQRQVGKTFVIDRFGKAEYDVYVRVDLQTDAWMRAAFDGDLDVDRLVNLISMASGTAGIRPGSSLIFLDGIQYCPRARTSLKYFTEDGRYDVIASGTMTDVENPHAGKPGALIPVGYEEQLTMHSLDFEEFLWAKGVDGDTVSDIRKHIRERTPADDDSVRCLEGLFREFMTVGGLPEAVNRYLETGDPAETAIPVSIALGMMRQDIFGYNRGRDAVKTLECFESIPTQLSQSNKKFMYSHIDGKGSRRSAEKYWRNIMWIGEAGYACLCHRLRTVQVPLICCIEPRCFKTYLPDTGILVHMLGPQTRKSLSEGDLSVNRGAVTENVISECLVKSGYTPRYYKNDRGKQMMELDFVIELGPEIAVIEVKSGKHREAPSIRKSGMFNDVSRRIMLENGNIDVDEEGIEHYPLFAAAFMQDMESEWEDPRFRPLTPRNR